MEPEPGIDDLEGAAGTVESEYPGVHVRFVRILGRRMSHLAGSASPEPCEQFSFVLYPGLAVIFSTAPAVPPEAIEARVRELLGG
jgi:hypothetical protein